MKKDWTGGNASVFKGISASNHAESERVPQDYYATEPKATEWLLKLEKFDGPILEPACGEGHISKVLIGGGILSLHATLSTEALAKWPTSWPSTIRNGTETSSPTHPMPAHSSLWRKHLLSSLKERRCACSSNSHSLKAKAAATCSRHNRRHGYGSAAHVCYVRQTVTLLQSKAVPLLTPGLSGKKAIMVTQ